MFKKLRNQFTIMNMTILSVLIISSFVFTYLFIYNNIESRINIDLSMMKAPPKIEREFNNQQNPFKYPEPRPFDKDTPFKTGIVAFIDKESNEISQLHSFLDLSNIDYASIIKEAISMNKKQEKIKQENYYWAFLVLEHFDDSILQINLIEISERVKILTTLTQAFVVVAVFLFISIWFVSRYFAKQSISPIEEAFNKQSKFISNASHELKTPITIIQTNMELVATNKEKSVESQLQWINNILNETKRMKNLTNNLLYLAQIEQKNSLEDIKEFSLSDLVLANILPFEPIFYEKNIAILSNLDDDIYIKGNYNEIEQVIYILLDNAAKYTPKDEQVIVNLTSSKSNKKAIIEISNSGEGIKEEDMPYLFDRFYRTDNSRNRETDGHGLGLAIALKIIKKHKGSISVKSNDNGITTFTIILPIQKKNID